MRIPAWVYYVGGAALLWWMLKQQPPPAPELPDWATDETGGPYL